MTNTTDYAASYFKYPTLNSINGGPTHKLLKRLKTELRANASSVNTDLGRGDHGYSGLVLTDTKYACIKLTTRSFCSSELHSTARDCSYSYIRGSHVDM